MINPSLHATMIMVVSYWQHLAVSQKEVSFIMSFLKDSTRPSASQSMHGKYFAEHNYIELSSVKEPLAPLRSSRSHTCPAEASWPKNISMGTLGWKRIKPARGWILSSLSHVKFRHWDTLSFCRSFIFFLRKNEIYETQKDSEAVVFVCRWIRAWVANNEEISESRKFRWTTCRIERISQSGQYVFYEQCLARFYSCSTTERLLFERWPFTCRLYSLQSYMPLMWTGKHLTTFLLLSLIKNYFLEVLFSS